VECIAVGVNQKSWKLVRNGRQPASKDVNTKVEGSVALEAVTRQRLAKTQQAEKT
jgi:hypothetical protein